MSRRLAALPALAALGLLLAACGGDAADVATEGTDRCAAIEQPPVQTGSHLLGDAAPPVPYSSTPPTSGWHSSVVPEVRVYGADEPLTEPQQVALLENGAVVFSYAGLDPSDVASLVEVAASMPGQVAVTPYDGLASGQVAATTWGALQVCDGVDAEALRGFAATFAAFDASDHS